MNMTKLNSREIIATNLKRLMDKNGHSQGYVHSKTGVAQSTIGRILKMEVSATIDNIDAIASFYGLFSWQMFVPDIDVSNPPVLKVLNEKEKQFYESIKKAAAELSKHEVKQ